MSRALLVPADVRFPLERANGIQIVKTAAALARAGATTTLLVRRSDPRPTHEILRLYGVAAHPGLVVERLLVGHRQGSFAIPRALFLARAAALAQAALFRGGIVFTRDLQLADLLLALPLRRVVYEAHALESLLYRERGSIYGTAEKPSPAKARRLARREARVWRRAAGIVTTTAGIATSFAEAYGARLRTCVIPNGCDVDPQAGFAGLAVERPARVLYAGQLYPWKGVDVLVEAVAQLPDVRLVILGGLEGERDHARVRERVAAHGLASRTEMPGTLPQVRVAEELARAAVVAVPFLRTAMTERPAELPGAPTNPHADILPPPPLTPSPHPAISHLALLIDGGCTGVVPGRCLSLIDGATCTNQLPVTCFL